ncbi:MAG: SRPBCC family protein [Deltaproteobacteria bacterium]|nr:SRPBCC family protein [Deltaproteobacteria bacterium]MBW2417148.1 SRPBCC family protein [Deltaproteobacteria bacterium]
MWFQLRSVEMDFLEDAPRVHVVESEVGLPREVVWRAFADATTWPHWFPNVHSASYLGEAPFGVGTTRISHVGTFHFEETMLAWEEGRRWAYRIDRCTFPLARAQLECTDLEDCGRGTRVRWTLALQPGLVLRLTAPLFEGTVQRLLDRALGRLEAYSAHSPSAR